MPRIEVVTGAGAANAQVLIQSALDAVGALLGGGGVVYVPDGFYVLDAPLLIGSNTHLQFDAGARIYRNFSQAVYPATIQNKDASNVNIRVSGGRIYAADASATGKHLVFRNVTGLTLDGISLLSVHEAWNTSIIDCVEVLVDRLIIRDEGGVYGLYEDGLHFCGGKRIVISNCIVECGDDALSLLNELSSAVTTPMEDVLVVNSYFYSHRVNPIKIQVMPDATGQFPIRRVRLANIVAKAGDGGPPAGFGIYIHGPAAGSDMVSEIEMDGVTLDASQNGGPPIEIQYAKRVRLQRVVCDRPLGPATIDGSDDVELRDCVVDSPRGSGVQCVRIVTGTACNNIRVIGGRYRNARQHAIQVGGSVAVNGYEIQGALIEGGPDTQFGIYVQRANNGLVSNNTIKGYGGWGILEDITNSSNNLFLGNRLFNNGVVGAGPISFGGLNSQAIRNVAQATVEPADSGGFRQTVDGWSILTTAMSGTEMTRWGVVPQGGRYRAARKGSITGLVIECANAISGGSVTATVWKNTGTPEATTGTTNTGYSITLSSGTKNSSTQAINLANFSAQDELYLVFTRSGAPTTTTLRCSFEVQI